MSTNKKSVSSKRSQSHSTFIEAANPIIHVLEKMHSVRTYVLGVITQKGRVRKIRVQTKSGAIRIVISGNGSTQEIWVYPHDGSLAEMVEELRGYQSHWQEYVCVFS